MFKNFFVLEVLNVGYFLRCEKYFINILSIIF